MEHLSQDRLYGAVMRIRADLDNSLTQETAFTNLLSWGYSTEESARAMLIYRYSYLESEKAMDSSSLDKQTQDDILAFQQVQARMQDQIPQSLYSSDPELPPLWDKNRAKFYKTFLIIIALASFAVLYFAGSSLFEVIFPANSINQWSRLGVSVLLLPILLPGVACLYLLPLLSLIGGFIFPKTNKKEFLIVFVISVLCIAGFWSKVLLAHSLIPK
jgi:hypothetical protein